MWLQKFTSIIDIIFYRSVPLYRHQWVLRLLILIQVYQMLPQISEQLTQKVLISKWIISKHSAKASGCKDGVTLPMQPVPMGNMSNRNIMKLTVMNQGNPQAAIMVILLKVYLFTK